MNPLLIKGFYATAAIAAYSICSFTAGGVVTASSASDPIAGFTNDIGADAGQIADITQIGLAEVRAGGTLTAGDAITSDANGHAVKATAGDVIAGIAQTDAVTDDVIPVLCALSGKV
jgi:hypothetical protein